LGRKYFKERNFSGEKNGVSKQGKKTALFLDGHFLKIWGKLGRGLISGPPKNIKEPWFLGGRGKF